MAKKNFKVSAGLKNIIGKDLVTDDFVAVFELVKNAFDANATRVDVCFENVTSDSSGRIIIKDNGKGMDVDDIENKWLFVAYSAKKDGTEDYRDKISSSRHYAGAKGIGRFSCDRLGSELSIYSRRNGDKKYSKLRLNWAEFEQNLTDEFAGVNVDVEVIDDTPYEFDCGVVLEIGALRSVWGSDKLISLKRSLEKLINPTQGNGTDKFEINIEADEFIAHDEAAIEQGNAHEVINGPVKNFVFEKLDLKTTRIAVEIDESGESIFTELYDRGEFVYRMVENNAYTYGKKKLHGIRVNLFSLNRSAKALFTKYMGVNQINFGSVFVYKNGFRIYPAGESVGGDIFLLDRRKQQGTQRYLGTRDIIGRVEIYGTNVDFQEVSSRDGGLIKNEAHEALTGFFKGTVLRRLERYAIDVVKYGQVDEFDTAGLPKDFDKSQALSLIQSLTDSKSLCDIEFNPLLFDIIGNASEKSLTTLLKNFTRIAAESNNKDLESEIEKVNGRLHELAAARLEAERETKREKERRRIAELEARKEAERAKKAEEQAEKDRIVTEYKTKESLFLRSIVSSDMDNVISLHHHIGISAGAIENYIKSVAKRIHGGDPVTTDDFLKVLERISYHARQITATTKFATKANFNLDAEIIEADLSDFIEEYAVNICTGLIKTYDNKSNISFNIDNRVVNGFISRFRPLEITIILDGLFSNARKARADSIDIAMHVDNSHLVMKVVDNGRGIKKQNQSKIFELGYTTTNGSGMGLHHVSEILSRIKGNIRYMDEITGGAGFEVSFSGKSN